VSALNYAHTIISANKPMMGVAKVEVVAINRVGANQLELELY
jgi:hypothetical protein